MVKSSVDMRPAWEEPVWHAQNNFNKSSQETDRKKSKFLLK